MHDERLDDKISGEDLIGKADCMLQEYCYSLDLAGQYSPYNDVSSVGCSADQ